MKFDGELENVTNIVSKLRTSYTEAADLERLEELATTLYQQYSLAENALVAMKERSQQWSKQ